jgi:predicted Zn-dependent protease
LILFKTVCAGIIPYTLDETGLAVVLGHEVGHALAVHGHERLSNVFLKSGINQEGKSIQRNNQL